MNRGGRVCTGPTHVRPTLLPLAAFHHHRTGERAGLPVSRCRDCINWAKLKVKDGPCGWIDVSPELRALAGELVSRCGAKPQLRLRFGLRDDTIRTIAAGSRTRIQQRTALRMLDALARQRRRDERYVLTPELRAELKAAVDAARRDQTIPVEGFCIGCGTPWTNQTRGCRSCMHRHYAYRRKARERGTA